MAVWTSAASVSRPMPAMSTSSRATATASLAWRAAMA
jgi:hypothetical protein